MPQIFDFWGLIYLYLLRRFTDKWNSNSNTNTSNWSTFFFSFLSHSFFIKKAACVIAACKQYIFFCIFCCYFLICQNDKNLLSLKHLLERQHFSNCCCGNNKNNIIWVTFPHTLTLSLSLPVSKRNWKG